MTPSPLIIAGFHRSGTSMTAQQLQAAGLDLGSQLFGGTASNPDGHFEDADVVRLHDRALAERDSNWQHADPTPIAVSLQRKRSFEAYVRRRSEPGTLWGFKDPRVCLFLETWAEICPSLSVVMVYRDYWSCTASLRDRHSLALIQGSSKNVHLRFWLEPELPLKMWLAYNRRLVEFARHHPGRCLVVSQDAVLHGYPIAAAVRRELGLPLEPQPPGTVNPLYAKAPSQPFFAVTGELQRELDGLWNELQTLSLDAAAEHELSHGEPAAVDASCDELRQRLIALCQEQCKPAADEPGLPKSLPSKLRACDIESIGDRLLAEGSSARAADLFARGVREFPRRPRFRLRLADALAQQDRLAEAESVLREGILRFPGHRPLQLRLAGIHASRLHFDAARQLWLQTLQNEPKSLEALGRLAALALSESDFPEAERLIADGLDTDPAHAPLLMALARLRAAQGRKGECADIVAALLHQAGQTSRFGAALGRLLIDLGFQEEVGQWLTRAREAAPDEPAIEEQWCRWLYREGRTAEALEHKSAAVKRLFQQRDQSPRLMSLVSRVSDEGCRRDLMSRFCKHIAALLAA
ncbi:tetratricopeptide repeat protein [Methylolobus aquaticus]|nr:tetratricopeptide repeat protein [Methylolobus aquaticus]